MDTETLRALYEIRARQSLHEALLVNITALACLRYADPKSAAAVIFDTMTEDFRTRAAPQGPIEDTNLDMLRRLTVAAVGDFSAKVLEQIAALPRPDRSTAEPSRSSA